MTNATFKGEPERLHKRGISEATCKKYRINREGNTLRFPYFTSDGVLAGFKIKNKQKVGKGAFSHKIQGKRQNSRAGA